MKTLLRRYFVLIRALPVLLSVAFALASSQSYGGAADLANAGETLLPLRTGVANPFSYGLYDLKSHAAAATNASAGNNLVLVVRNVGARWVNFPDVATEDFTLKDSRGRAIKLELRDRPQPISFGEATVIQIFVPKTAEDSKPWTLRFKSTSAAKIPFDVSISGIKI